MAWVRLDDHFDEHPKMAQVGPLGLALWATGLAYCNRNLTDGFIPWATARSMVSWEFLGPPDAAGRRRLCHVGVTSGMAGEDVTGSFVIDLLLEAGLWEEADGGYRIHDYLDYQPSKEYVESERRHINEVRSAAGRLGGMRSGEARRSKIEAKSKQNESPVPKPVLVPTPQKDTPDAIHTLLPAAAERAPKAPKALEPRYSPEFEAWWSAYPRKREKVDAYKAYQSTLKAGADPADLLAAARHYATAAEEQGAEDRFIKLPATFLGPARPWLDFRQGVPHAAARANGTNGHRPAPPSKLAQNAAILRSLMETRE